MKKKAKTKEKTDPYAHLDQSDLLVFGYASKIFRDDAKALSIDRGESFIPWMGDSNLKLDRYDGRIHLTSVEPYLPSKHSTSELEEYERAEEELCEEERWRALYKDDLDEAHEEEEEKKRQTAAGQIGFSYEENGEELPAQGPELPPDHTLPEEEEEEEEYVPDPALQVTTDLVLPPTIKLYSVILKTAKFLSTQGQQMEILLKAKQASNPAFQFLNPMDPLYTFFKHLVYMIKTKQFVPDAASEEPDDNSSATLTYQPAAQRADIAPVIPTIKYKQSADCSYLALINKIKAVAPPPREATPPQLEPEVKKELTPPPKVDTPPPAAMAATPPPPDKVDTPPPEAKTVEPPATVAPGPRGPPPPRHSYLRPPFRPPPIHGLPPGPPPHVYGPPPPGFGPPPFIPPHPSLMGHGPPPPSVHLQHPPVQQVIQPPPLLQASVPPPAAASNQPPPPGEEGEMEVPPSAIQTIIDKMASYVARNGRTFEEVVKMKDRNKFSFLFEGDKFHKYYRHKLQVYTPESQEESKPIEPLAFKVKKTEEKDTHLPTASALPAEGSSGSGDEGQDGSQAKEPTSIRAETTIYDQGEEKKRLEDQNKLKDKLAAAAREKMIINAKERATQLERKRKAAKFLELLAMKKPGVSSAEPVELEEGELPLGAWPPVAPPGPPGLVIPTLAGPVEIKSSDSDSSHDSSTSSSRRKRRKHGSKHRSRSRDRKKRRSRSRSSRKKKKKKEKKKSKRKHKSRSRSRSSSRSRSRSPSRKKKRRRTRRHSSSDSDIEEVTPHRSKVYDPLRSLKTKENTPSSAGTADESEAVVKVVQPALNEMTEDLRAKVRAMLGSSN